MYTFFFYAVAAPETYRHAVISADLEKIDLFGDAYIFEYIGIYTNDIKFRNYIADNLKYLVEITAGLGRNKVEIPRYYDFIHPEKVEKEQSANEVISKFKKKIGLEVIKSECV